MARITVEDCIDKFESRFELVLVASNRARKLHSGETPTVEKDNDKNTVIALREIADETISADEFKNNLVEEYQIVSPIDEEELALEFDDKDVDQESISNDQENLEDEHLSTKESNDIEEKINDIEESNIETNNDEILSNISENQTDQSS